MMTAADERAMRTQPAVTVMTDAGFLRIGALGAWVVAVSSLLYAVAYLIIMPAAQREDDVDAFFRSYAADPNGRRLASACFIVAGLAGTFAVLALAQRLRGASVAWARWLGIAGVVGNLLGAAHGLWALSRLEELSALYAAEANRAAVAVVYRQPSAVDPQALFRFGLAGMIAIGFGLLILRAPDLPRALGWLGVALGVDSLALFAVSWAGLDAPVLVTGGLAALILVPVFWVWAGVRLWGDAGPTAGSIP